MWPRRWRSSATTRLKTRSLPWFNRACGIVSRFVVEGLQELHKVLENAAVLHPEMLLPGMLETYAVGTAEAPVTRRGTAPSRSYQRLKDSASVVADQAMRAGNALRRSRVVDSDDLRALILRSKMRWSSAWQLTSRPLQHTGCHVNAEESVRTSTSTSTCRSISAKRAGTRAVQ